MPWGRIMRILVAIMLVMFISGAIGENKTITSEKYVAKTGELNIGTRVVSDPGGMG